MDKETERETAAPEETTIEKQTDSISIGYLLSGPFIWPGDVDYYFKETPHLHPQPFGLALALAVAGSNHQYGGPLGAPTVPMGVLP